MLMGLYFLALAVCNTLFNNNFVTVFNLWRKSVPCKLLSAISLLSFQMSHYMVLVLSVERFVAVCFPLKSVFTSIKTYRIILLLGWLLNSAIAFIPVVHIYMTDESINNAMCVMMFNIQHIPFSYVLVVTILNTVLVFGNISLSSALIKSVQARNQQFSGTKTHVTRNSESAIITLRTIMSIVTSSICWFVLLIVGILLVSGVAIDSRDFSKTIVSVLPVCTLINPILNVYSTPNILRDLRSSLGLK